MPSYQVYLPPRLVDLKHAPSADVPITFRTIPRSLDLDSVSQSRSQAGSLLGRLLVDHTTKLEQDRKGKRRAIDIGIDDGDTTPIARIAKTQAEQPFERPLNDVDPPEYPPFSPTQESPQALGHDSRDTSTRHAVDKDDQSRGVSKRLKATELMAALPDLQADDSILSLNTTMSNPSQIPLSGQEGDTSMYNLPRWTIPLSKLSTLDILIKTHGHRPVPSSQSLDAKVHVIVCVTSTTAPVVRKRKEERVRGQDGTLWIAKWDVIALSDTGGREVGCEVVLWDKCARDYGEKVRRGDVVLLENVEFRPASKRDKAQLILSTSFPTPRPVILYRTIPRLEAPSDYIRASPRNKGRAQGPVPAKIIPEDRALRPDLRIARSDPGIRRVVEIVKWFADWVGGDGP